jgi:hypothetical protein
MNGTWKLRLALWDIWHQCSDADNDNPPSRDRHGKTMATEFGSKGLSLSRELWTIRVILFSSSSKTVAWNLLPYNLLSSLFPTLHLPTMKTMPTGKRIDWEQCVFPFKILSNLSCDTFCERHIHKSVMRYPTRSLCCGRFVMSRIIGQESSGGKCLHKHACRPKPLRFRLEIFDVSKSS